MFPNMFYRVKVIKMYRNDSLATRGRRNTTKKDFDIETYLEENLKKGMTEEEVREVLMALRAKNRE